MVGAGALCLTTALVLRTVGQRIERSGGLKRQASPRAQRIAQVVAGLVLLGIAVAVLSAGDLDLTARGLPRWLVGGLNLVVGTALLGWAALRPRLPQA